MNYSGKSLMSYKENDKDIDEIISSLKGSGSQFSRLFQLLKQREGIYELFHKDTVISSALQVLVEREVEKYLGLDRGYCSVKSVSASDKELITECFVGNGLIRCFSFGLSLLNEESPY